ncbi:MAG: tetratricopeptide repeat protein [Bacteroidota bacterium]|nr:tetratricopeptide repeat protein [Bacteroidota bacterium]
MNKIIKYFLFGSAVLLFQLNLFGQTIDSLKLALKTAKHDTVRCTILSALAETANENEWPVFNEQLRVLTKKNADLLAASHPLKKFYLKLHAFALNNFGYLYDEKGDITKALDYYFRSIKIHEELGNKSGIASSLNNIGFIYKKQGDIQKALEYYHKSLKIKEEIGDKKGVSKSLNNFGSLYKDQGDLSKALEYYEKSLKILLETQDKRAIATLINNIGTIYNSKEDLPKALDYCQQSLKLREEDGDKSGIANSLSTLANIYKKQGNITKAIEYHQKSLIIYEEIGEKKGEATSIINLANMLAKGNQLNNALLYANKAMKISKDLGFPEHIYRSAKVIKTIYQKQNKFKDAFEMFELEIKMRDSINNQETQKATVKKQIQYKYEKLAFQDSVAHAKENEIKNAEIAKQTAEVKNKKNQQYGLFGGLVLVMVFAGFIFNRFKVTQKQKHIIEIKEKETQHQKHIIEEKHKEITDSINYAERIQRSFIATKEMLDENLNDYFVYFLPKDVVSGDFYWAGKLNNGNFALVTADSTGHGVPGAIMSLLNITSLEKAIENYTEPSEILNSTRKTIIERLKKDGSPGGGKDGMDASLTVYDFKNNKLIIAAANNPIWIVRGRKDEAEVIEIKPDKMPVGKHDKDTVSFTQQEIQLQSGDVVYTLTDGFPDQFGGKKGKKFMTKNLKELLSANAHLPMNEQKQILEKTFTNWIDNLEQVDDVTLIGVRV